MRDFAIELRHAQDCATQFASDKFQLAGNRGHLTFASFLRAVRSHQADIIRNDQFEIAVPFSRELLRDRAKDRRSQPGTVLELKLEICKPISSVLDALARTF